MTNVAKKVSIAVMAALLAAAMCLPMFILPAKAYADVIVSYAIGDTGPGGGIVFYDKGIESDGWRYLEAKTSDLGSTNQWSNVNSPIGVTAQGTAIGTGKSNTDAIIAQTGHTSSAALMCKNYNGGGFTDWFLPSRDELYQMYLNRGIIGGFQSYSYWSSSEEPAPNDDHVYARGFQNGINYGLFKQYSIDYPYVRPIRAFSGITESHHKKAIVIDTETNAGFVTLLYNQILGRAPDETGLANQVAALDGGLSRMDLVSNFIFSEECQNKISGYTNEQFIKFLYQALFNRVPESSGLANWLEAMDAGMTKADVVNAFTHSEEFAYLYL